MEPRTTRSQSRPRPTTPTPSSSLEEGQTNDTSQNSQESPTKKRRGATSTETPSRALKQLALVTPAKIKLKLEDDLVPEAVVAVPVLQQEEDEEKEAVLLHPALKFEYAHAVAHLSALDPRWGAIMAQYPCKPFEAEQDVPFNPFQ